VSFVVREGNVTESLPRYVGPEVDVGTDGRKMTQEEIKARFDAESAAVYSRGRGLPWLPEHGAVMSLLIETLRAYLPACARVLDLGAGTGNLARRILRAFPDAHVTLADFSPNMLGEAPRVLKPFAGRYETVLADFWQGQFPEAAYDGVVSSFALHHGRGAAMVGDLYRKVYRWLKTPGVFLCCDVVEGDAPELAQLNEAGWRGFLQQRKFAVEQIEHIFSNYRREDSPLSLRQHLALLERAGFSAADVLWKRFNFAVYVGVKA
jgi:tRNA (cmo5U34)-methyltransferase